MAKALSKRFWNEVKADYEGGMSQAQLRKKYNLGAGTLGNKIKRDGWRLSHKQTTALSEFKDASVKISESFHEANEIQKKELIEQTKTILENNELIQNNRKILKDFQALIKNGIKEKKMYQTASDIRAGVGAIKDIESVANPRTNTNIEIKNSVQSTNIELTEAELKKKLIERGLPIDII